MTSDLYQRIHGRMATPARPWPARFVFDVSARSFRVEKVEVRAEGNVPLRLLQNGYTLLWVPLRPRAVSRSLAAGDYSTEGFTFPEDLRVAGPLVLEAPDGIPPVIIHQAVLTVRWV